MGAPFAGRGGSVSGPVRRRFIFPGGGLGARLRLPVLPSGEVGQEKGNDTRADSLMLIAPNVSIARSHTSDLGSESEPGTPQDSHPPKSM
jgi:hypothetical protein